jgi:hypothetical protein
LVLVFRQIFATDWKTLYAFGLDKSKNCWEQPFSFGINPFPMVDTTDTMDFDSITGARPAREAFIPKHLPPYPPSHTYARKTKKRASETATTSAAAATSKRPKQTIAKDALNALSTIEDTADVQ